MSEIFGTYVKRNVAGVDDDNTSVRIYRVTRQIEKIKRTNKHSVGINNTLLYGIRWCLILYKEQHNKLLKNSDNTYIIQSVKKK